MEMKFLVGVAASVNNNITRQLWRVRCGGHKQTLSLSRIQMYDCVGLFPPSHTHTLSNKYARTRVEDASRKII